MIQLAYSETKMLCTLFYLFAPALQKSYAHHWATEMFKSHFMSVEAEMMLQWAENHSHWEQKKLSVLKQIWHIWHFYGSKIHFECYCGWNIF